jgi:MYND finger
MDRPTNESFTMPPKTDRQEESPSFRPGDRVVLLGDLDVPDDEQDVSATPDASATGDPRRASRSMFAESVAGDPACHVCGACEGDPIRRGTNGNGASSSHPTVATTLMTCAACHSIKYCCREHQKEDWKRHKAECKVRAKGRQRYYTNMHGTVAEVLEPERNEGVALVVVDLDLSMERVRVSTAVLEREPAIPEESQLRRARLSNGTLVEAEGRAMDTVLNCLRCVTASVFMGMSDVRSAGDIVAMISSRTPHSLLVINQISAKAWSVWSDGRGFCGTDGKGSYQMMRDYVVEQLYEEGPPAARSDPDLILAKDAVDDPRAAKGWNVRVCGCFWIVDMDEDGTYLVSDTNRAMVYQCVGIRNAIYPMLQQQFPDRVVCMNATMIPWYGRLVYDGVLTPPHNFRQPLVASEGLASKLREHVERAKRRGSVISRLAQLEVPGGSLVGLHDAAADPSSTQSGGSSNDQEPPTPQELKLLEKLAKIRKIPGTRSFDPMEEPELMMSLPAPNGQWVFRRVGYTEIDNPNHMGVVINSGGNMVGPFQCSALKPTAVDVLKALLQHSAKARVRPALIGVDEYGCHERCKFLLRHAGVDGTSTFYYPPATTEETSSAMRASPF